MAVADGLELRPQTIRLTSDMTAFDQPRHSFYTLLGRSFMASTLRFEVVRPPSRPVGAIAVGTDTDDGRALTLLPGIDVARAAAHAIDLGPILNGAGILSLRISDPSRVLPAADRARWLLTVQGRFR